MPQGGRSGGAGRADYIGFGCLFPTRTKGDTTPASLEELERVRKAVSIPIVAIGGIDVSNLASAIRSGADAAAVISAVMQADDCGTAVIKLLRQYRLGKDS
ncbi:MAG: thiamine phosphate synthase [Syntrophotaleaceae bacterium]